MEFNGLTQDNLVKNVIALRAAIAESMGISIEKVHLIDVVEHTDGQLELKLKIPLSVKVPSTLGSVVTALIENIDGFENVRVITSKSSSNFQSFLHLSVSSFCQPHEL